MFLATTALSEFWDKRDRLLFLGSWCLRYDRRREWEELEYEVLPSPWDDRKRFYDAARYVDECGERILGRLSDYLDNMHRARRGLRYWRILVGPWLMHALQAAYDRYVHLCDAFERHPDLRTIVLDRASFCVPGDTAGALGLLFDDGYNLQLISLLLEGMGYEFPARPLERLESGVPVVGRGRGLGRLAGRVKPVLGRALRAVAAPIHRTSGVAWLGDLGFAASMAWDMTWRTRLRAIPMGTDGATFVAMPGPTFDQGRLALATLSAGSGFESIFTRSLPYLLPPLYLEGFAEAKEEVQRRWPGVPRLLLSGGDWYFNEPFKYVASEAAIRGARLVAVQHGGGYGTFRFAAAELHESRVSDAFLVWGWADDRAGSKNVPNPKITALVASRQADSESERRRDVLVMTTAHPRYLYRFHSQPVGSQWDEYFKWMLRFLTALPQRVRSVAVFRPYAHDYGHGVRERIAARFPDLRWDSGEPFQRRLRTARLVVIDHNATGCLETLGANIPTVLFWDPDRWEVRESAVPYFDRLREAGILFGSPEAAAAKVSAVYDRPWEWWGDPATQQTRRLFADRYALARSDWQNQWLGVLREELDRH